MIEPMSLSYARTLILDANICRRACSAANIGVRILTIHGPCMYGDVSLTGYCILSQVYLTMPRYVAKKLIRSSTALAHLSRSSLVDCSFEQQSSACVSCRPTTLSMLAFSTESNMMVVTYRCRILVRNELTNVVDSEASHTLHSM